MGTGLGQLDARFSGVNGVANRLITKYGTTFAISYQSGGVYNPITRAYDTPGTPVSYDIAASPPEPYSLKEIDGTTVIQGDLKSLIPAAQTTEKPPVGATVVYDSATWSIEDSQPIKSGNETAAYEIQLRRV